MSHTTRFEAPGWQRASLIHNGDWSGPTELRAWRTNDPDKDTLAKPDFEVTIAEDRSCCVTRYFNVDISSLATLFVGAGRAMGISQLSDAVSRATESFK